LPWAIFILIVSRSTVLSSLEHLESFQDSGNPGYFLIKLALWLMASVVIVQAVVDLFRPSQAGDA